MVTFSWAPQAFACGRIAHSQPLTEGADVSPQGCLTKDYPNLMLAILFGISENLSSESPQTLYSAKRAEPLPDIAA